MKTLGQYLNQQTNPLMDSDANTFTAVPEFMKDEQFMINLQCYLMDNYGLHRMLPRYDLELTWGLIPTVLTNLYANNAYMLNGLWQTTQQIYNPIENYSMTEDGTDTHQGTDTTTNEIGETKTTEQIGQRVDTNNPGETTTTNEHSVSPENTANYTAESKDVITSAPREDKFTAGSQTNVYSGDTHTDKETMEHGHEIVHHLTRSGNIGVTTSQQMLESERDIVNFNIYKVIADLVVSMLCVRVHTWERSDIAW